MALLGHEIASGVTGTELFSLSNFLQTRNCQLILCGRILDGKSGEIMFELRRNSTALAFFGTRDPSDFQGSKRNLECFWGTIFYRWKIYRWTQLQKASVLYVWRKIRKSFGRKSESFLFLAREIHQTFDSMVKSQHVEAEPFPTS